MFCLRDSLTNHVTEMTETTPTNLLEEWNDAYAAFADAFDTPQMRMVIANDYAKDARERLRAVHDKLQSALVAVDATTQANAERWLHCEEICHSQSDASGSEYLTVSLPRSTETPDCKSTAELFRWAIDQARPEFSPAAVATRPELAVWYGSMPESNGRSNWTALLYRKDGPLWDGITLARSEYPDRVRYEADCVRWLIGELEEEPFILDYDADKNTTPASDLTKPGVSDHHVALLVNRLRNVAVGFHATQQLREHISALVVPFIRAVREDARTVELSEEDLVRGLHQHRLKVDKPSQLSDAFRAGAKWAVDPYSRSGVGPKPTLTADILAQAIRRADGNDDLGAGQLAERLLPEILAHVAPSNEQILRRMLCVAYAGVLAYLDDGEAQDNREYPFIDFRRDSLETIRRKFGERNRKAIAALTAVGG